MSDTPPAGATEEQEQEQEEQEKKHTFSFPALSLPLKPFVQERVTMELAPDLPATWRALRFLRELLGHLDDYELIQRATGAKDRSVAALWKGIHTGLPHGYEPNKPEEYEQFLTRLEVLALEYLATFLPPSLSTTVLYLRYTRAYSPDFSSSGIRQEKHPQVLLVYALAIGCLGEPAYYYAQMLLEYFDYYRIEVSELAWVRHCLVSYRYSYPFFRDSPPDFSRSSSSSF